MWTRILLSIKSVKGCGQQTANIVNVGKDYSSLKNRIAGDVSAAAATASLASGGKNKKLRVRESDLPSVIPNGATVTVESVPFAKLNMGDIICVNLNKQTRLRRFIKLKMTSDDVLLLTGYEGRKTKDPLVKTSLIGRVVEVETESGRRDPCKENVVQQFWNKLTEYGTHKPFGLG